MADRKFESLMFASENSAKVRGQVAALNPHLARATLRFDCADAYVSCYTSCIVPPM